MNDVIRSDFNFRSPDLPSVKRQHRSTRAAMDHPTQGPIMPVEYLANQSVGRDKTPFIQAQHPAFHPTPLQRLAQTRSVNPTTTRQRFG
jgi:hypothetical protein